MESNKEVNSSNLDYWSDIMKKDPFNKKLNSFSFGEKYKIIEAAYNKLGIRSKYKYEEIASKLKLESSVGDELFNRGNQINRLAYWVFCLWGSNMNLPRSPDEKFNYVKLSDQIWLFEGEQGDLNYNNYVRNLIRMRSDANEFSEWTEEYVDQSNNYEIDFKYQDKTIHWNIENEIGGSINNDVFKQFTELCESEYIDEGNYFLMMESGGGLIMFLSNDDEKYLRTLWDFPKLNKKGKMMTLSEYGQL